MNDYLEKIKDRKAKYSGVSNVKIASCKLELTKNFSKEMAGAYPFLNNPHTRAGWCKPECQYRLQKYDSLYMSLDYDGLKIPVSGQLGNIIFIPEYAVSPYLFDKKYDMENLDKPSLDSFSSKVFLTAIHKSLNPDKKN
jgi:hypothetical protein